MILHSNLTIPVEAFSQNDKPKAVCEFLQHNFCGSIFVFTFSDSHR
jgi:hypothetical protein